MSVCARSGSNFSMLDHGRSVVWRALRVADRVFDLRGWLCGSDSAPHPLAGDRAIEWSWIVANLPALSSRVLDLGCVGSPLSCIASRLGHKVVAVDLRDIEYEMERITFVCEDLNVLNFGARRFDVILNCSMIEHVGIEGRYGSGPRCDGDLAAMELLVELLDRDGRMLLTIPVGRDGLYAPYHRVYGAARLPRLLKGFAVEKEEYWHKDDRPHWTICDRNTALKTAASEQQYALGLFVLTRS